MRVEDRVLTREWEEPITRICSSTGSLYGGWRRMRASFDGFRCDPNPIKHWLWPDVMVRFEQNDKNVTRYTMHLGSHPFVSRLFGSTIV